MTMFAQLVPVFVYDAQHGKNTMAFERYPEESMTYGLNIAELLLPVAGHRVGKLAAKRALYDQRSGLGSNESSWSSFGMIGAIGFILLLIVLLVRAGMRVSRDLESLALLNLAGILGATVGGFGTLFNFYVRPEIRAYNRISTLLAFLALSAIALLGTEFVKRRWPTMPRGIAAGFMIALLAAGLFDQTTPRMVPPYAANAAMASSDHTFMTAVASAVPHDGAIFELPWVRFPESAPAAQLDPENLYRPYLQSSGLRFSYGDVDGRDPAPWEAIIARMDIPSMLRSIVLGGYNGLIVFRQGYVDGGESINAQLRPWLGTPINSPDGSLAFYSLEPLRKRVVAAAPTVSTLGFQQQFVRIVQPVFANGFSIEERDPHQTWHWAEQRGTIMLRNASGRTRPMRFRGQLQLGTGTAAVTITTPGKTIAVNASPQALPFDISFNAPPGSSTIELATNAAPLVVPGDPRRLAMRLINARIEPAETLPVAVEAVFATPPQKRQVVTPLYASDGAVVALRSGCSAEESKELQRWVWCGPSSTFTVSSKRKMSVRFTAIASTPGAPTSPLTAKTDGLAHAIAVVPTGTPISLDLTLTPHHPVNLAFSSSAAPLIAPGDARTLVLRLDNVAIRAR